MTEQPIRIAFAGGGTGGHVLPAVAVLEAAKRRGILFVGLWIGSSAGLEKDAAAEAGIAYAAIQTGKLRRYLDKKTITDAVRVPIGAGQAFRILRTFRPDVILSTGGFVSVPTVMAGARLAPIITHEQTAILGLATKINLRFADVLALSFPETVDLAKGSRARIVVTGNPVRGSILTGNAERGRSRFGFEPGLPIVYVTGGARGASPLSERIEAILPQLLERCAVVHQTGPAMANDDARRLRDLRLTLLGRLQARYHVSEFIRDELADLYAATSLVIGRAGAGTVAELAALGLPAILVPLPLSGGGEQDRHADLLAKAGAAINLPQPDATPERLLAEIFGLLDAPTRLAAMADVQRSRARLDAADLLLDEVLALAKAGR